MDLEKNNEWDDHYMKEKYFQDIVDESRTLEVVRDKERYERMLKLETLHPIKDNSILD